MGELTLGIVFMVFLILFLSSDVGKEINDKINNSPEVRARRALEELERQQQQTINEQTKQTEAVKTQTVNTVPQKKAEPQPVRNDPLPQEPTPKPQSKVESTPKQQPKPKSKPKPEPVKVTEVQESMFPEVPLEKGDEVTALLDSDGIYYIDNRKASGIIWIPYTEDALPALYLLDDLFDIEFEERGAVITQGYPAWRVMIR